MCSSLWKLLPCNQFPRALGFGLKSRLRAPEPRIWGVCMIAGGKGVLHSGSGLSGGLGCYRHRYVNPTRLSAGNLEYGCATALYGFRSHFRRGDFRGVIESTADAAAFRFVMH